MVEYPARPSISATHTAETIAAEGAAGVEVAELTVYLFHAWDLGVTLPSSSRVKNVSDLPDHEAGEWCASIEPATPDFLGQRALKLDGQPDVVSGFIANTFAINISMHSAPNQAADLALPETRAASHEACAR
jgi:hypothetical protein